jgi:hypothetical protein
MIFGRVVPGQAGAAGGQAEAFAVTGGVAFENGESARLPGQDARSAALREVLNQARESQVPVLVEVEGPDNDIAELRVPLPPDGVSDVREVDERGLEVALIVSQRLYSLPRSHPDFEVLRDRLLRARAAGTKVVVTSTEDGELVHVAETDVPFPLAPEAGAEARPENAPAPIPLAQAGALFAQVAATSCNPLIPMLPCVTFLYPDDGCYARAHEVCRLVGPPQTRKVWIFGNLVARTRNHESCQVRWRYHVAAAVYVQTGAGVTTYVLDPSLFSKPVPVDVWKGAQGDSFAIVVESGPEPYFWGPDGKPRTDPVYAETNVALATFRLALMARSAGAKGPPPYAACSNVPVG